MTTLKDRTALVIGGSRGIGAAVVERLAAEGARVAFSYAGSAEAAAALAARTGAAAHRADAADAAATEALIGGLGRLDILVYSAGIALFGDALEADPAAVDRMFDVNVRGAWRAAVASARRMGEGGRIVFIGSVNGDRIPMPGLAAYSLTKSAVQGMTRGLARDLGPRGITVNNVQPGPVDTDMNPADGPLKDLMHAQLAIRRHGRPEEIAGLVAFLVGPEAGYITGAQHTIDGGFGA